MNKEENDITPEIDMSTVFQPPQQEIIINEIPDGKIIDIGGGGEGIIAQIGGKNVTVIDRSQNEIDEAKDKAPDAKWVVADSRDLPQNIGSFDNATAFFSGMYMINSDKKKTFQEVAKIIPLGGELWIWDAVISLKKEKFLIMMKVTLPNQKLINTGYGVKAKLQNINEYENMLSSTGFQVIDKDIHEYWLFIKAKKI
ncbi:MAG: class I SAM-dependent methyltransferase [Candidatus Hodarchaeales archaeon]|jgi:ubiquinone/menaquinone biosynthesis C-methylase UbiE